MATLIRTIFAQPDGPSVWAQLERVVDQLEAKFAEVAAALVDMAPDLLAFTSFPRSTGARSGPTTRRGLIKSSGVRCGRDIPQPGGGYRLIGAVLAEQNDEWAVTRRYMSPEALAKARLRPIDGQGTQGPSDTPIEALTA